MSRRRVVITGIGLVCPLGWDHEQVFADMLAGKSGVGPITKFDPTGMDVRISAELKGFDPEKWIAKREAKRLDPFCHYAIAAADMALEDSGLKIDSLDRDRCGVILGSGIGGIAEFEDQHGKFLRSGPSRVSPFFIPRMMINSGAGVLGMRYDFRGLNYATVSACASASHAAGAAFRAILYDEADVILTGGSEAALTRLAVTGFISAQALSKRNDEPERASRPFDRDRDGFVFGEGAGILVFEELEQAKRRGAVPYAEVIGFGMTADAFHVTQPHPDGRGAVASMVNAVKDAAVNIERVNYINAHGTSTQLNDAIETMAIKTAFGDHARKISINSTKSMIGHLLGASGGVELAVTAMSVKKNMVHPTANYETPDPECDLDYVPNEARELDVDVALCNSFGFGGHNATIAITKVR